MPKLCDLHTHSIHSDGTMTPAELIDHAIGCDLSALALTDHNTVSGLRDFITAAAGRPIDIAPGIEFTTDDGGEELHILGLFVRPEKFNEINKYINRVTILKEESNYRLINKLNEHGYRINYVDILERSKGYINRANIAAELLRKGYITSIKEAFDTILSEKKGLYEPPEKLSSIETIRFIRSIGAVAVWAHPYLSVSFDWAEECPSTEFRRTWLRRDIPLRRSWRKTVIRQTRKRYHIPVQR